MNTLDVTYRKLHIVLNTIDKKNLIIAYQTMNILYWGKFQTLCYNLGTKIRPR